jgi:HAD superfamily hydrolase (TIGR01509 family)
MIKGVFFDVGGTLYSYSQYPAVMAYVCSQVSDRFDLSEPTTGLLDSLMQATKQVDQKLAVQPFYLFRQYFEEICRGFLAAVTPAHTDEDVRWCMTEMEHRLMNQLELKPDCHQTLSAIKAQGLYTSVVSNSDIHQLDTLIERHDLAPYFDHITSSEAAQSCKPDRRFFEVALDKSGLQPHEVLFVGDSLEQDIAGAKAAGLGTVLITEEGMITPMHIGGIEVEPDYRVTTLNELLGLLPE